MNPIELGKFIANLRNEKHLTQEDLADKLFIDKRKISRWECGTSIPEFEMLIKLSEILDVSLYELSICKRVNNKNLSRKVLDKFKSIKDIKKYNTKKKILYFFILIIIVFFIITTIYTIKYNNTIEVYELSSMDKEFTIVGTYERINNSHILNITKIDLNQKDKYSKLAENNCIYEIYDNLYRLFSFSNIEEKHNDSTISNYHDKLEDNYHINSKLTIKIRCKVNDKEENYLYKIKTTKIYDNKLF